MKVSIRYRSDSTTGETRSRSALNEKKLARPKSGSAPDESIVMTYIRLIPTGVSTSSRSDSRTTECID